MSKFCKKLSHTIYGSKYPNSCVGEVPKIALCAIGSGYQIARYPLGFEKGLPFACLRPFDVIEKVKT